MPIIAGGVLEKDGKYLLVQESKQKCYGKWNLPAGHIDAQELLFDGAVREIKEETNCDVKLTGVCIIATQRCEEPSVYFVFATKILTDDVKPQEGEILEAKWFSYEEIINMHDELRAPEWIIPSISAYRNDDILPLSIITVTERKVQ